MTKPTKFVGLHAHDGFSTFDGLGYPQEHVDFVRENGMNALAITNHGHMNSFAHAYLYVEKINKAGANFKFIPGCEMYVHPDLDVWQVQYDLKKAKKKADVQEVERLQDLLQSMTEDSIFSAIVDDSSDLMEDSAGGLTVENENETKSGKFFDPIKRRHHLVVLPRTTTGLQRLFHLVSRGYTDGFYRFPRIDYKMLREAAEGGHILISTACLGGPLSYEVFKQFDGVEFDEMGPHLLDDEEIRGRVLTNIGVAWKGLCDAVGDEHAFLELQFNRLGAQHLVNRALIDFARMHGLVNKLIVTCDSHYSRPEHWKERELYKKLGWLNHKDYSADALPQSIEDLKCELYPKNADQVWQSYLDTGDTYDFYDDDEVCAAIERTHWIAYDLIEDIEPDTSVKLPKYVIPEGVSAETALVKACKEGLIERGLHKDPEYVAQLKTELRVIMDKDFAEYFLTTKAIIDLARKRMFVGPGRGSGAGSLVNYVLGITDVDPLKYGLLFERFLSPDRTDLPDIDTDVGDRDKLLEMMREEYGNENIIPISNYNTFKLKSLVKDISRFYGVPFAKVNKALSTLDNDIKGGLRRDKVTLNGPLEPNLEWAMKYSDKFVALIEEHPEIAEPIDVLFKQNKALGRHAGGVIVSENIAQRMPLILARGELQTPWVEGASFKHLENFGWVKFDLLGLETLRIIERSIELILKRKNGKDVVAFEDIRKWFAENMDPTILDLDDQKVYENVYHSGRWAGIFQCTNNGSQKLFQAAQPQSIIDIATLTSIYRPGPLGANVHRLYIRNKKNPEDIQYGHELIRNVLEPTYGCIIFQEQVMELANKVAGIPKAECNTVRKMMKPSGASKDALQKAKALEKRFVSGCVENGVRTDIAKQLYDDIMKFAAYGFNKSHAVAYALDSYYCAWLMTYYEEEWLCAYLESMEANPEKRGKAFSEVKALGYEIVPIDINHAESNWTILDGKKFMPSFFSCKGIGSAAIDEIVKNRPFTTVKQMLWNEDGSWKPSKFNKRAVENLIRIRAFDSMDEVGSNKTFESYRHMHEAIVPNWNSLRKSPKRNRLEGQENLCMAIEQTLGLDEWTRQEIIENEMNLLGSVNADTFVPTRLQDLFEDEGWHPIDEYKEPWVYWFIVLQVMPKKTKNNRFYLRAKVMGLNGKQEWLNIWSWNGKDPLPNYSICVAQVSANSFGKSTSMKKLEIYV